MILHAASIAAVFIDWVTEAPVVVQCAQAAPDPLWKWWVQNVLPVAGGTLIAVWSFVQNRKSEQKQWERNQKAGHEEWILDQKKAEWSALLRGVANVFHITNFTPLNGWNGKIANRVATELEQALEEISIACANCIFLANFRQNKEGEKKIDEFLKNTKLQAQKLKGNLGLFESMSDRAGIATDKEIKSLDRNIEIVSGQISNLAEQSRTLLDWLQDEAALDLGVTAKAEEHQAARRSTKLFNFTRKKTGV